MLFPEEIDLGDGARLRLFPNVLGPDWFQRLRDELLWEEEYLTIYGQRRLVPRLTAYYGDLNYGYSGVMRQAAPMPASLQEMKQQAESIADFSFNSVLGNYYRQGSDSMGWHADDEPEMDTRCIASVSLGATRRFRLKHKSEAGRSIGLDLTGGSLLLMEHCQENWMHSLPKTARPIDGRINLTFRRIKARD